MYRRISYTVPTAGRGLDATGRAAAIGERARRGGGGKGTRSVHTVSQFYHLRAFPADSCFQQVVEPHNARYRQALQHKTKHRSSELLLN